MAAVTAVLGAGLALVAPALSATAAPSSLTVTVKGGTGLAQNIFVELQEYVGSGQWNYVAYDTTELDGTVHFTGLVTGHKYAVKADVLWDQYNTVLTAGDIGDYGTTWLGSTTAYERDAAGTFTATSSFTKTLNLKQGYVASGTVKVPGGAALTGDSATVQAYRKVVDEYGTRFEWSSNAISDSSTGSYSMDSLAPGNYVFLFMPPPGHLWGAVYNGGGILQGSAPVVTITSSDIVLDQQLADGGQINGDVTLDGTLPTSHPGFYGVAYAYATDDPGRDPVSFDSIDSDTGHYTLELAPGEYKVLFELYESDFQSEWFDNAATQSTASSIFVSAGASSVAHADLGTGFSLNGTVTRAGGSPLQGYDVVVEYVDGPTYGDSPYTTTTDVDGGYEFLELPPGAYQVTVSDPSGEDATRYVTSTGSSDEYNDAEQVSSVSATVTRNVEFPITASVDVTVTSATGAVVSSPYLLLISVEDGAAGSSFAFAEPTGGGHYRATGLDPSLQYTAYVYTPTAGFYSQYLGGGVTLDEAQLVTFEPGSNSLLFTVAAGQKASGTVKNSAGYAVKNADVAAYYFNGSEYDQVAMARTSSTGKWSIGNLRPGSYRFAFYGPDGSNYLPAFSGNKSSLDEATAIYLGPGKSITSNATLRTGGKITGVIKGAGGASFGQGFVLAYPLVGTVGSFTATTEAIGYSQVSSTGKYSFSGLPAGYYALSYEQYSGATLYPDSWIGGIDPLTSATPVKVTAGKTSVVPTWLAPLHPGVGSVSGSVVPDSGTVEADSYELFIAKVGGGVYQSITIGADPAFTFSDLPDGDYVLGFYGYNVQTGETVYEAVAQTVTVSGGANTGNVISLHPSEAFEVTSSPSISGTNAVGENLEVDLATTNKSAEVTYQWFRQPEGPDSRTVISGATNAEYAVQPSDFGSTLFVRETFTSTVGASGIDVSSEQVSTLVSAGTTATGAAPSPLGFGPAIVSNGPVIPGTVLKADPGEWAPEGARFTYRWEVDGIEQVGQTGKTFTVTDDMVEYASQVTLVVRATRDNSAVSGEFGSTVALSLGTAPVATTKPVVSHSGSTYSVTNGTWNTPNLAISYQWYEDGDVVPGATSRTFVHTDMTKGLYVRVSAQRNGFHTGGVYAIGAKGTALPASTPAPVVTNLTTSDPADATHSAAAGDVLSVDAGFYTFPDGSSGPVTPTYQWQSSTNGTSWSSITGARAQNFTVPVSLVGKKLRASVTLASPTYATFTLTSDPASLTPNPALTSPLSDASVAGTGTLGSTLTAIPAEYNVTGLTYTYQWLVNGVERIGQTAKTFVLNPATVASGDSITVAVTAHKPGYLNDTQVSSGLPVQDNSIRNIMQPRIVQGTIVKAGTTLTASVGKWDVSSPTFEYMWTVSSVLKSTSSSYTPTADLAGSEVRLLVRASKAGFTGSDWTDAENVTFLMPATTGPAPAIATFTLNPARVGEELTAHSDLFNVFVFADNAHSQATVKYQWYRGSTAITNANQYAYTPTVADLNFAVKVKMSVSSPFYAPASYTTDAVTVGLGEAPVGGIGVDYVGADVRPGTVLTATHAPEWGAGTTFKYQWKRSLDGGTSWTNIPAATKQKYTVTTTDPESTITVAITGTRPGYGSTSAWTSPLTVLHTGDLSWVTASTISGTSVVGSTVTVTPGHLTVPTAKITYQWRANGAAIPGATSPSLVIAPSLYGHTLTVELTATSPGYIIESTVSEAVVVGKAAAPTVVTTKKPAITGGASTCMLLSVSQGAWTVGGAEFDYEWFRGATGDTSTPLATTAKYQAEVADVGSTIWVRVTAQAFGYAKGTYNSVATPVVSIDNFCV